ncbi:hypothetical protein HO173_006193 [Letharia columbiana]|uniref:Uncharacterized protein n=1 Tax=Letharia columbiana TaxID=112416 RepID=A0A8H6FVE8_9LECA|nr:uncharacterized protein HO173_006193 [Letharia columbiana]KAF6235510.1 hypothetical protein HO173_006193 [Letharia columbiana]
MEAERAKLPGFGLPVNYRSDKYFPNAVLHWSGTILTVRELNMMAIMDKITDKPDWDQKVFDDTIVQKWRQEALGTEGMDVSEKMLHWCFAELRDKARSFRSDGMIPTLDLDAAVIKSDTAISSELKEALRAGIAPLEDVPDRLKDWHPGSDGKVLDLVHPSLFPLIYGRSKVLSSGNVGLQDCVSCIGKGEIATTPDDTEVNVIDRSKLTYDTWGDTKFWSKAFQWLPCDVKFAGDDVKITSYINNLHPTSHPSLYSVIEKFIAKSIPLWNLTLSSTHAGRKARILHDYTDYDYPRGDSPPKEIGDDWDTHSNWMRANRVLQRPEPREFESYQRPVGEQVSLRREFGEQGLQVIVKLANIELTPEKPTYDGGSWHVEGQLNERICATALYYYDSKNVADNFLTFRHRTDEQDFELKSHDQDDHEGVEELYGVEQEGPKVQEIGRVVTREGRLLAFPNVFQHRVAPFKLEDHSTPGHRKILALFLVDPHCRIISTANVPPQQKDWWSPEIRESGRLAKLPKEIVDQVVEDVEDFPISLEEAKELRLELMEERKVYVEEVNKDIQSLTFFFCEH